MRDRLWARITAAPVAWGLAACVGATQLPFAQACLPPPSNAARMMGVDPGGTIYAVAFCGGDVAVTTSADDGADWSPPQVVGQTVAPPTIVGGPLPGEALVAWLQDGHVKVRTTTNGGGSWDPEVTAMDLAGSPDIGFCAVATPTAYHVLLANYGASETYDTTRSLDGGRTWEPKVPGTASWRFGDLVFDPLHDEMHVLIDDPRVFRVTSVDGGRSYAAVEPLPGDCCVHHSDWAMGCGGIAYATGDSALPGPDEIWRYRFGASIDLTPFVGLTMAAQQQRAVTIDPAGSAFTVSAAWDDGRIELVRWGVRDAAPDAAIAIAPFGQWPHVLATGIDEAAVTWQDRSGALQFVQLCLGPDCAVNSCLPHLTLLRNGDLTTLSPPTPPLSSLLAIGNPSGLPGETSLDRNAPAVRYPDFVPGALGGELVSVGEPLVYYELEEPDGAGRVIRLSKSGVSLVIDF